MRERESSWERKRRASLWIRRAKVRELDYIFVSDSEEGRMSIPPFPNSFHSIFLWVLWVIFLMENGFF